MGNTGLFIKPTDEVKIKIWIGILDDSLIGAIDESSKEDDIEYTEYNMTFREPNYLDVSDLADKSMTITQEGEYAMGLAKVRLSRVKKLLRSWDLKDEDGKKVPVSEDSIDQLNPVVAFTIAAALEETLGISGELEEETVAEEVSTTDAT